MVFKSTSARTILATKSTTSAFLGRAIQWVYLRCEELRRLFEDPKGKEAHRDRLVRQWGELRQAGGPPRRFWQAGGEFWHPLLASTADTLISETKPGNLGILGHLLDFAAVFLKTAHREDRSRAREAWKEWRGEAVSNGGRQAFSYLRAGEPVLDEVSPVPGCFSSALRARLSEPVDIWCKAWHVGVDQQPLLLPAISAPVPAPVPAARLQHISSR
eukprot:1868127-Pyramimonas_sp.AAC.1